jgi:hypothetical protein
VPGLSGDDQYVDVLWREVLVPDHVVASDGLTAEVGGVVEMSLQLFCRYRTLLGPDEPSASVTRVSGAYVDAGREWVHELVGRVVEVDSCRWAEGWVIDVDGLAVYVHESGASSGPALRVENSVRERGSDPPTPLPEPGSRVRVRGGLSVAESYETDMFEPVDELLRRAERRWHVRRIVRLDDEVGTPGSPSQRHRVDVAAMRFDDLRYGNGRSTFGYLLDLEHPSSC